MRRQEQALWHLLHQHPKLWYVWKDLPINGDVAAIHTCEFMRFCVQKLVTIQVNAAAAHRGKVEILHAFVGSS
jgi:hypothetical protein